MALNDSDGKQSRHLTRLTWLRFGLQQNSQPVLAKTGRQYNLYKKWINKSNLHTGAKENIWAH